MPWYASTLESFAVTHVRPAPPERIDARRAEREKNARAERSSAERHAFAASRAG